MNLRRDTLLTATGAALFVFSLAVVSIVVPLMAIAAGYSAVEVGVLVGWSGFTQIVARAVLGRIMRFLPDRTIVIASGVLLAVSFVVLMASTSWISFTVSALCQGWSRAAFWTGSQTHVVRVTRDSVRALALVNIFGGIGGLLGPVVVGVALTRSSTLALAVGVAGALSSVAVALNLVRFDAFGPRPSARTRVLHRPGVITGGWANAAAGAWYGLLASYMPIVLSAHHSPTTIGLLVSIGNGSVLVGATACVRIPEARVPSSLRILIVVTGATTALIAWSAPNAVLAALAMSVSGAGAGALQTIGPAAMSRVVRPDERGDAMALAGTFRAIALFMSPVAVAGIAIFTPVGLAMSATGVLVAALAFAARG